MNTKAIEKIRGFTLIELIMVFAVIGMLVAFAMPNYIEQNNKAEIAIIQKDILLVESYVGEKRILDPVLLDGFEDETINTLNYHKNQGVLYDNRGKVSDINGTEFKYIPESEINKIIPIESQGVFLANREGNVYFIDAQD